MLGVLFCFFKQKPAYEMRISDWSSDVCSSDLPDRNPMAISPSTSKPQHARNADGHGNVGLAGLMVGAVGVVFGDIGTSPLYTIKQAFSPHYGLIANPDTVLGLLSLVFWSLMLVVRSEERRVGKGCVSTCISR